jgi:hypothetical protein
MKRIPLSFVPLLMLLAIAVSACNGNSNNKNSGKWPDGFASWSDAAKLDYLMKETTPDSVARFICDASLGRVEGVKIDTLVTATLYVYEHYKDADLNTFSDEYDNYSSNLPLADKMKILSLAGEADPQGLGFQLGLEYAEEIRNRQMTPAQVDAEIAALEKTCADDQSTFARFMKGFQTVLKMDGGSDLPAEVVKKYSK